MAVNAVVLLLVEYFNSNVPQGGIGPHIKFERDPSNIFRVRALTSSASMGGRGRVVKTTISLNTSYGDIIRSSLLAPICLYLPLFGPNTRLYQIVSAYKYYVSQQKSITVNNLSQQKSITWSSKIQTFIRIFFKQKRIFWYLSAQTTTLKGSQLCTYRYLLYRKYIINGIKKVTVFYTIFIP